MFFDLLKIVALGLNTIILILVAVAYYTLAERKVMAAIQRRLGPNVVGIWGLLQPLADGVKAAFKEALLPKRANIAIFILAPGLSLFLSFLGWIVIPFSYYSTAADISLGILYLLAISSMNVYGIVLAGWSSNSRYSFLGAIRSSAQMISYEVSIGLIVLPVAMLAKSFNLKDIILSQISVWYVLPLLPLAFIFFVCSLAETNRAPFDLPEAEAELVAGYNLEYSGLMFAMFFLGEYSNMLLMSALNVIFFWGGWLPYFSTLIPIQCTLHVLSEHWIICIFAFVVKILIYCHLFILIRATLPRYRYDQLMDLGWKFFLPFTFAFLIIVFVILITKYDLTQEVLFSLNIGGEWIQSSSISVLTNKHNV